MFSNSKILVENALKEETDKKIKLIRFAAAEQTAEQTKKDLNVLFDQDTINALIKLLVSDPKTLTTILQNAKNKKTIKEEQNKHDLKRPYVGQILYSAFGYDCTLIHFYQVIKATKCFVWVKQLNTTVTENVDGYGQQTMKRPVKNSFMDGCKTLRRKIMPDAYKSYEVAISKYEYASPWNGADIYEDTLD